MYRVLSSVGDGSIAKTAENKGRRFYISFVSCNIYGSLICVLHLFVTCWLQLGSELKL